MSYNKFEKEARFHGERPVTRQERFRAGDPDPLDTSTLGRICVDPNKDAVIVRMVREAMLRTDSPAMGHASIWATDEACLKLYRMLKN